MEKSRHWYLNKVRLEVGVDLVYLFYSMKLSVCFQCDLIFDEVPRKMLCCVALAHILTFWSYLPVAFDWKSFPAKEYFGLVNTKQNIGLVCILI